MKNNILSMLLLFLIVSCANPPQETTESTAEKQTKALSFVSKKLNKESDTCATDSMKCASVSIRYLQAQNAPKTVLKNINDTLNWYYTNSITSFGEDDFTADIKLEKATETFIKEYDIFLKDMEDDGDDAFITPWTIEIESDVEHVSDKTACIFMGTYSYTGGAHPNYFASLMNFDVKTGKKLSLEDFIKDKATLTKIAESAFRKEKEMGTTENLNEAGYFWDETFGLPENIGLGEEGLKLYYNPYEIAPYALGVTEFVIPYEQLTDVLK